MSKQGVTCLKDSMGAARVLIGRGLATGANVGAVFEESQNVLHGVNGLVSQTHHLHLVLAILEDSQLGLLV